MPAGQTLGDKQKYKYTMDDGTAIKLKMDETLGGLAGTGLAVVTTADDVQNKPTNFKPRVVHVQALIDGKLRRKKIICEATGTLYASNVEQNVTIDGVEFQTTGRSGESYSF